MNVDEDKLFLFIFHFLEGKKRQRLGEDSGCNNTLLYNIIKINIRLVFLIAEIACRSNKFYLKHFICSAFK